MTELQINIDEKTFANGTCAIRGLQFKAVAGQFTAIVGPSGAGKSTLLNIISGLDEDFKGTVEFASESTPRIGFMFQESRLLPWLTVQQNIELVTQGLAEQERIEANNRITQLLEHVGLQDFNHVFPRQLSIGMQRRVSLVRALVMQPDLLLMDEPFQSLDEPTAEQLRELLMDLWQETRASVLFVTHNLREALTLTDRVLFLSARPARVMLEYSVNLERPRLAHGDSLDRMHNELLNEHPELLSGRINGK